MQRTLDDSISLGVKEYYFTGGEPFMNREIVEILGDALKLGPTTVLTNATLLSNRKVEALASIAAQSLYSLEFRVSIDGVSPQTNDAIRGPGTFTRALLGVERLVAVGFLPIITAMQSWPDDQHDQVLEDFRHLLSEIGYRKARVKILPPLHIGEEASRSRQYSNGERVSHDMMAGYDIDQLLCTRARLVTAQGVFACPILLDYPSARLGGSLRETTEKRVALAEQACFTCYMNGAICSNVGVGSGTAA